METFLGRAAGANKRLKARLTRLVGLASGGDAGAAQHVVAHALRDRPNLGDIGGADASFGEDARELLRHSVEGAVIKAAVHEGCVTGAHILDRVHIGAGEGQEQRRPLLLTRSVVETVRGWGCGLRRAMAAYVAVLDQ